jgi:hypothetical protein
MKILLLLISTRKFKNTRLKYVTDTWLNDVDNYIIISDENNDNPKTIKATNDDSYESNTIKNLFALKYAYDNYNNYDWIFICDDDAFINYENLKIELIKYPLDEPIMVGQIINCFPEEKELYYCSGGAGYATNMNAVKKMYNTICNYKTNIQFADVVIGKIAKIDNIKLIDNDKFRGQPPKFYNYENNEIKNKISFHYIREPEHMNDLYNILKK